MRLLASGILQPFGYSPPFVWCTPDRQSFPPEVPQSNHSLSEEVWRQFSPAVLSFPVSVPVRFASLPFFSPASVLNRYKPGRTALKHSTQPLPDRFP